MLYSNDSHPQAHQDASVLTAGPSASPDVAIGNLDILFCVCVCLWKLF